MPCVDLLQSRLREIGFRTGVEDIAFGFLSRDKYAIIYSRAIQAKRQNSVLVVVMVCGRYMFSSESSPEILQIAQEVDRRYGESSWTPGEISPSMTAPVLIADSHSIYPKLFSWGYKMEKSLVFNARAETASEKPLFRDSMVDKRCVIPSTGFFEWDSRKRKYLFTLPENDALYMAGLYAVRNGKPCFCILTTEANSSMQKVHHRMPLVLQRDQIGPWLEKPEVAYSILCIVPPMLEKVSADEQISFW